MSLGTLDGNGDPGGIIRGGVNGVGRLTVSDLVFGTGATQSFRIMSAGTPAGLNTGGSSGGSAGNPLNNNYLHVTGSLIPYSLFNGGPDEFNTFRFIIDGTGTTFAQGQSYSYQVGQIDFNLIGILLGDITIGAGAGEQAQFSTVGLANASDFSWTLTTEGDVFLNFTVSPVPEPTMVLALAAGALGLGKLVRQPHSSRARRTLESLPPGLAVVNPETHARFDLDSAGPSLGHRLHRCIYADRRVHRLRLCRPHKKLGQRSRDCGNAPLALSPDTFDPDWRVITLG